MTSKIETRFPTHQNAVELFEGHWLARLEEVHPGLRSGTGDYFRFDTRPVRAANQLGFVRGSLHGMKVLELGPMEGAHTYQLSMLGADSVTAVEANSHAYLRCLVMKEILQPARVRFLLGDALKFLQENSERWDLIFCSGILYHMVDPYALIEAMAARTDRIFLWTHFHDPADPKGPRMAAKPVERGGLALNYHQHTYQESYGLDGSTAAAHWGGVDAGASWMERDQMLAAFQRQGLKSKLLDERRDMDAGHHLMAVFIRDGEFNKPPV